MKHSLWHLLFDLYYNFGTLHVTIFSLSVMHACCFARLKSVLFFTVAFPYKE